MSAITVGEHTVLVDRIDFKKVKDHRWWVYVHDGGKIDVKARIGGRCILIHNFILGIVGVDHKNGDRLDNRRSNMRPATSRQNNCNRKKSAGKSSIYKGVCAWDRHKNGSAWRASIRLDGNLTHLGYFRSELDAARAYDSAAIKLFGEFARPNFNPQPV